MKAMILAGGLSTRLYPLTKAVPKPLVPVAGVPNAAHLLRYLKSYGFDEIYINVHYLADAIVAALGDGSGFGVTLHYSHEPELLGSAGGVKKVEDFFAGGDFLVIGCDEVTDMRLDRLLEFHRDRSAVATIGLVPCEEVDQYGVVLLDERAKIVGFQEKPPKGSELSKLANTGVYLFSPEIFERIPPGAFYDFGKQVFPELQQTAAPFYGFEAADTYWSDIGTPSEYRRANYDVLRGIVTIPGALLGIDPTAAVGRDVRLEGAVRLCAGARIGDGACIVGPSVVGAGASVEARARLERAILWEGSRVGDGAVLRDTVVGMNYSVPAGTIIEDALVATEG